MAVLKSFEPFSGHNFKHFLPISVICAFGFFNRPTFVVFAFVPLFFWFMRGVAMNSALTPFQVFNFRCLSLIPGKLLKSVLVRRIGGTAQHRGSVRASHPAVLG